jgi:hypothetical protein
MRTGGMVFLNWIDCFTALPFLSPAELLLCDRGSGRGEEPSGGESPPPDSDPFKRVASCPIRLLDLSRTFSCLSRAFHTELAHP